MSRPRRGTALLCPQGVHLGQEGCRHPRRQPRASHVGSLQRAAYPVPPDPASNGGCPGKRFGRSAPPGRAPSGAVLVDQPAVAIGDDDDRLVPVDVPGEQILRASSQILRPDGEAGKTRQGGRHVDPVLDLLHRRISAKDDALGWPRPSRRRPHAGPAGRLRLSRTLRASRSSDGRRRH